VTRSKKHKVEDKPYGEALREGLKKTEKLEVGTVDCVEFICVLQCSFSVWRPNHANHKRLVNAFWHAHRSAEAAA
jgi:hypothetical protein